MRNALTVFGIVFTISAMAIFVIVKDDHMPPPNTDPRNGIVYINGWTTKQCDGTTLVYTIDRGGNAITNSPECQP